VQLEGSFLKSIWPSFRQAGGHHDKAASCEVKQDDHGAPRSREGMLVMEVGAQSADFLRKE